MRAAGVVLAVVAVELMPQALKAASPWIIILSFLAGGGLFMVVDALLDIVGSRYGGEKGQAGPWMIFFGVSVDLFSDGIMIGAGSTLSFGLGQLLALGQVPADIPEGFATVAAFKDRGVPRRTRLLAGAAFALPIFLGTTIGYFGVRDRPEVLKLALLAFTAGMLTTVTVEEIVPRRIRERRRSGRPSPLSSFCALYLPLRLSRLKAPGLSATPGEWTTQRKRERDERMVQRFSRERCGCPILRWDIT